MGVWIETHYVLEILQEDYVTPCMGVWIETKPARRGAVQDEVTPCMGVWIETESLEIQEYLFQSHPVWVCGLKPYYHKSDLHNRQSHPVWVCGLKLYDCGESTICQPCMGVWIETYNNYIKIEH